MRLRFRSCSPERGADPACRVKSELKAIAGRKEMLVPVRLEYEYEAYKLRDTFTWNLRGSSLHLSAPVPTDARTTAQKRS